MAKFCSNCKTFRGSINTCTICGFNFCKDCRAMDNICKDCFIESEQKQIFKDYNNFKSEGVMQ